MKYRNKSVIVEAIQWVDNTDEVLEFCEGNASCYLFDAVWIEGKGPVCEKLTIHTLEGDMKADENDYIIKGVNGEFYPCKPDIFEKTYELVEEGTNDE